MSKYSRGYDITNRHSSDFSTRNYDSPRYTERGKLNLDKFDSDVTSPSFEFGVSYKSSPKNHDTSTKTHDISTKSYDRSTKIDDVTTRRSPARNTSISDRDVVGRQTNVDPPIDRRRPRRGSNDSSSSHSSEKSAGTEDRSLLSALKHRYQENAEKHYEDPGTRAPFSSWRRSGNFEEVTSSIAPEAQKEKTKSLERKTYHGDSDKSYLKTDSYRDDRSRSSSKDTERSRSGARELSAVSEKKTELSPDDLIYNFRQALCRHALSEQEKSLEHEKVTSAPKTNIEDDATLARLERLRAARAKIHEQRNSDKTNSLTFATEFKLESKQEKEKQRDKSRSSSVSSDKGKASSDEVTKTDELKHRQSTKLARQKLVSDDLRAKYMIKREDEKEKTSVEPSSSTEDGLARKRSERKQRLKEHTEIWSKEPAAEATTVTTAEKKDVPSMEDMLLGSKPQSKTSSVAKKFQNVDHSSPFGSVYSRPSSVVVTTTSPLTTTVSPSVTSTTTTTTSRIASTDETVKSEKLKNETPDIKPVETEPIESKDSNKNKKPKSDRKYKKYNQKSKSLELGLLSENVKTEPEVKPIETQDDIKVNNEQNEEDLTQLNRQERIAKYKEERRKQLKTIQDKFSAGEMPSLFLSSKSETDSPVKRTHSLKVETENKYAPYGSSVSRSKSLKEESDKDLSDYSGRSSPMRDVPKVTPSLRLAEIGNQETGASTDARVQKRSGDPSKKSEADKIIEKLHALKKLTKEQLQRSHEHNSSHEDHVDIGQTSSYTSRTLLADRVMDDSSSSRERTLTPTRDRVRSSSRETDSGKSDKIEHTKHKFNREPEKQKSYFEFGTVFSKKEAKPELKKSFDRSSSAETSSKEDNVTENVESSARIRRKLPSIEDVLGTNETETVKSPKEIVEVKPTPKEIIEIKSTPKEIVEVKPTEVEKKSSVKVDLTKEDISVMRAEEIHKRKIAGNIERAKNKFLEEEKQAGSLEASRFELGTVYGAKKEDKPKPFSAEQKLPRPKEPESYESKQQVKLNIETSSVKTEEVPERQVTKIVDKPFENVDSSFEPQIAHAKVKIPAQAEVKSPDNVKSETQTAQILSPRSERRRRAEQKFGKVSYRSSDAFEFGTTYAKKEPSEEKSPAPISQKQPNDAFEFGTTYAKKERIEDIATPSLSEKQPKPVKEKSPELAPETMKEPKKVFERESKINQVNEPVPQQPSYAYSKPAVQAVSKTVIQATEITPSAPREMSPARKMSPVRSIVTAAPMKAETVSEKPLSQPTSVEIQSKKQHKEMFARVPSKEDQQVVRPRVERTPSLEVKVEKSVSEKKDKPPPPVPEKPVRPPTERQTSFTQLELKSPVDSKAKDETSMQAVVTEQKSETPAPKPERQLSSGGISIDAGEIKSAFDVHKKLVEGKIEEQSQKRRSSNLEEWAIQVDRPDMKSDLFEVHKKQIEMKLEKREPVHVEKQIVKQDSEAFELHKKQIQEKLELKYKPVSDRPDDEEEGEEKTETTEEKVRAEIEKNRKIEAEKQRRLELAARQPHLDELSKRLEKVRVESPAEVQEPLRMKTEITEKRESVRLRANIPEQKKGKIERALMETSLDDILIKNVDYLSDMESIQLKTAKDAKKKHRPQSMNEHQKPKRSFKKKSGSKRSKSEERSQFQVSDDDAGAAGRSEVNVGEGQYQRSSRVKDSREVTTRVRRRRFVQKTL